MYLVECGVPCLACTSALLPFRSPDFVFDAVTTRARAVVYSGGLVQEGRELPLLRVRSTHKSDPKAHDAR